jgi:hypothetical protein
MPLTQVQIEQFNNDLNAVIARCEDERRRALDDRLAALRSVADAQAALDTCQAAVAQANGTAAKAELDAGRTRNGAMTAASEKFALDAATADAARQKATAAAGSARQAHEQRAADAYDQALHDLERQPYISLPDRDAARQKLADTRDQAYAKAAQDERDAVAKADDEWTANENQTALQAHIDSNQSAEAEYDARMRTIAQTRDAEIQTANDDLAAALGRIPATASIELAYQRALADIQARGDTDKDAVYRQMRGDA